MTTTIAPPPGPVPGAVTGDVDRVRAALAAQIPAKTSKNLLIGTWNLRAFGDLTHKWQSTQDDSPKRDWHALSCIAEIVERFDVTAVQETRRDTTALFALLSLLGPRYKVIASDVTEGGPGNGERLAYVYDAERVQPSGLVGSLSFPPRRAATSSSSPARPMPLASCVRPPSSS